MKPRSAKSKGRTWLNEIKALVLKWYPTAHADDIWLTPSGVNGEDVQFSDELRNKLPVSIEGKRGKSFSIDKAYKQACDNVKAPHHKPMVVWRRDRGEAMCTLRFEDFLELTRR